MSSPLGLASLVESFISRIYNPRWLLWIAPFYSHSYSQSLENGPRAVPFEIFHWLNHLQPYLLDLLAVYTTLDGSFGLISWIESSTAIATAIASSLVPKLVPTTLFIGVLLSRCWCKYEEFHAKIASSAWLASHLKSLSIWYMITYKTQTSRRGSIGDSLGERRLPWPVYQTDLLEIRHYKLRSIR